ncbi:MAG: ABC transporter permease, partial [Deltaproteobacteria bacterium]|nr:ABC transporter permease [Deltaproteobacteria bacterium]
MAARNKRKPWPSRFKREALTSLPQTLCWGLGRLALNAPKWLIQRQWSQISFAGRLILVGLWGDPRQSARNLFSFRLFLQETWLLFKTSGGLMVLLGLLTGFMWDAIWFGVLENIGGAEQLVSLAFSIHLQEITPILATAAITMGHGVPMTVDLAMRKSQGEFALLTSLGVPPERYLGWPRLLGGWVGLPILFLILAISFLLALYLGARLTFGLNPMDFFSLAKTSLVEFNFLKFGAKCLLVGFCLNFFCLYASWHVDEGQLRSIAWQSRR